MINRISDWPTHLANFLAEKKDTPFEWGVNDCCLFTCDWLKILTGIDPASDLRGKYTDALSAARILKEQAGIQNLVANYCKKYAWDEVSPSLAQRGDLIILQLDETQGPALGICLGQNSAFAGQNGYILQPTLKAISTWHIK
jgi:hypothetical protein